MNPFDYFDEFYISNTLTPAQIRGSINKCRVKESVAASFAGTDLEDDDCRFPWSALRECLESALKHQRPVKTIVQKPGHIDIAAVKERNDVVDVVERYTRLRKSGSRFAGRCPIHNDKNPSLIVYPDRQSWHCFGCGKGGDVIKFVQIMENTDFRGAVAMLGGG